MCRDVIRFERSSHFQQKFLRVFSPFRKNYIVNWFALRTRAHFQFLTVHQKLTFSTIKLWCKLFEISNRVHTRVIRTLNGSKYPLSRRKDTILDSDNELRNFSQQVIWDIPGCWIMSRIKMRRIGSSFIS